MSLEPVAFATLEWIDWSSNQRLLEPTGIIPSAEAEARCYAMIEPPRMAAWVQQNCLRKPEAVHSDHDGSL